MLRLNNKAERIKTVKQLPTPKISVKQIRREYNLLIKYMESRKLQKDKNKVYRFLIGGDNLEYKGVNYFYSMQITFSLKENDKVAIEQIPANIWINKDEYSEDYWLFRKGPVIMGYGYIARSYEEWKEVQSSHWRYEFETLGINEEEIEKINLLFQIPEFKLFYSKIKNENIDLWDFKSYLLNWNQDKSNNKWFKRSLENGWYHIYKQSYNQHGNTIHELLGLPKYLSKKFSGQVLNKYKNNKSFNLAYFKDAIEMMRKRDPEFKNHLNLFLTSWNNVKQLHNHLTYIREYKEELKENEIAKIKAEYKKIFRQTKYKIKIQKPRTKKDLKKIGNELKNCVGDSDYRPKDIFVIVYNGKKICVEFNWKTSTFTQILSYRNMSVSNRIKKIVKETIRNYIYKEVANVTK